MRHMLLCLLDALDERVDEIVHSREDFSGDSPIHAQLKDAEETLLSKLPSELHEEFDALLSMQRQYAFEGQRLCYLNGFQDHCKLAAGNLDVTALLEHHKP